MSRSHQDRVALVTGAAGGLGGPFALRLAREGCHIAITDRAPTDDLVAAIRATGRDVHFEPCDLADGEAVERLAAGVLARFGRCDILVNNAAYMPLLPLERIDRDAFRRFLAINLEAPLILARILGADMAGRGYGRIVQIASSTIGNPMPGFCSYIATKMGGVGLVRGLAAELGPKGITVNAISPGLTKTPSSEKELPAALFEAVVQRQLIKRTEVPEDLCGTLAFLTSEDAGFITGQNIFVDGGTVF